MGKFGVAGYLGDVAGSKDSDFHIIEQETGFYNLFRKLFKLNLKKEEYG